VQAHPDSRIVAAERMKDGVFIEFDDGTCALFSSSLLRDTLPKASKYGIAPDFNNPSSRFSAENLLSPLGPEHPKKQGTGWGRMKSRPVVNNRKTPATPLRNERWREAKRPRNRLAGGYGKPVHPLLVPIPIGAWLASLVFDIASRAGGPPHLLYVASYWLLGIGIVVAIVAAASGFLDLLQVPAGTHALRFGLVHMGLNLTALTLYIGDFLLRWVWSSGEGGVPAGLIVLSAIAFALLAVAGHMGGILAYRYGVRVADESTQRLAYGASARGEK